MCVHLLHTTHHVAQYDTFRAYLVLLRGAKGCPGALLAQPYVRGIPSLTVIVSHGTQLALKALPMWKIACGTYISTSLFWRPRCCKNGVQGNPRLVISHRSWYTSYVEQVD